MFVVGGISSPASGIASTVGKLSSALVDEGTDVTVFVADTGRRGCSEFATSEEVRRVVEPGRWAFRLQYSRKLRHRIAASVSDFDVIHNHNLWVLPTHYSSTFAHQAGKPVIFSSHGYFMDSALRHSRWKKRLAGVLFQDKDLDRSACIHALTKGEIDGIRSHIKRPIVVIPNGVDTREFDVPVRPRHELLTSYKIPANKQIILFLGRLHPIKGIANLIPAWKSLCQQHRDWHLVFVGPDGGMLQTIQQETETEPLKSSVTIAGPMFGQDKCDLLIHADALVLPSVSEGLSLTILEALAARLPVVISAGCNFPEVAEHNCGTVVDASVAALADGLRGVMTVSIEERQMMGRCGRTLVENKYAWPKIARQMQKMYRWTIGENASSDLEIYD